MRKLAFILITLAAGTAFSQSPTVRKPPASVQGDVSGFYRLTVKDEESQKTSEINVYFRQTDGILEMYDLASKRKYSSEIHRTTTVGIKGINVVDFAAFELKGPEKKSVPLLMVALTHESVHAVGVSKKQQMEVAVESLASVWACGNHQNPTHTAKSEAEIKEKTASHGCSLWHKLSSAGMQ